MNKAILMGRLTKDTELKTTPGGKTVIQFTLAVDRGKDQTDFIPCVAWEKTAEFIHTYFGRGAMIAIEGRIQTSEWEKDGHKNKAVEVVAERAYFCGREKNQDTELAARTIEDPTKTYQELAEDTDLPF